MLASTVPAVGRLDPKRANDSNTTAAALAPAEQGSGEFTTAEELDALIGAGGGEATGSSAKKGGKRRKA